MTKTTTKNKRISITIDSELHTKLTVIAAKYGYKRLTTMISATITHIIDPKRRINDISEIIPIKYDRQRKHTENNS